MYHVRVICFGLNDNIMLSCQSHLEIATLNKIHLVKMMCKVLFLKIRAFVHVADCILYKCIQLE